MGKRYSSVPERDLKKRYEEHQPSTEKNEPGPKRAQQFMQWYPKQLVEKLTK